MARNRQYWRRLPYPASGDRVTFTGSEILFQYFPGEGLQLHPLSTFKKANLIHGACVRDEPRLRPRRRSRALLDEMEKLAVQRGRRFIAWEYLFDFGGGAPPWMSGMAQATGIQALARAADLLDQPRYLKTARRALGAFETLPPTGVRAVGPAGGHPLPPVLVRAAAVDLQRVPPVADRALRLLQGHRRRARPQALRGRRAGGARGAPAVRPGRLVALQLRRPRVLARTTTSCCASSSRACARAGSARPTAPTPGATAATRPTRRCSS